MSNDYFKAQGWFKTYALNSQDSRGVFQQLVKEDEEAFRLASAETDKIKAMINKKYGPGSMKYGSEIPQPDPRQDVIEIDAINAFMRRNPAAEGGRMIDSIRPGFRKGGFEKMNLERRLKAYNELKEIYGKKTIEEAFENQFGTSFENIAGKKEYKGRTVTNIIDGFKKKIKGINRSSATSPIYNEKTGHIYKTSNRFGTFYSKNPGKNQYSGKLLTENTELIEAIKEDAPTMSDKEIKEKYNIHKKTLKKIKDQNDITTRSSYLPEGEQKKSIPYAERYTAEEKSTMYKKRKETETDEDRAKAKERDKKYRDKIYKDYKMEPSSRTPYDDLWKDIARSSKDGERIKLVEGPKVYSGASYDDFKTRVFLDTKTGETFNYNNLKQYLDSGKLDGVTYNSVIEPYNLKNQIAKSGLREEIQKAYFGEKYKPPSKFRAQNTFHVHHIGGVAADPFSVQLTFADENLGLVANKKFNTEWAKLIERNAPLSERKNYLKFVKKQIGDNIAQTLEFPEVGKVRTYGEIGTDMQKLLSNKKFENINLTEIQAYITDTTGKVKQPMLSSGFAGAYEMLSDDLKAITNTEGFKKFSKIAKTPGKFFGIGDVALGYLDYKNNIGKGDSEKLATKKALQAMSFGLWKGGDREYLNELKETYIKNGGDESVFDQVISLNKQNSELMGLVEKTKEQYQRESENEKTFGTAGGPEAIKFKLDVPSASNTLKTNLSAIKTKAENMDKDFTTFTETYKGTDLTQPSKDIKAAAFEDLTEKKKKAFDTQSKQLNTEAGPIGNWLLNNLFTFDPLGKAKKQAYITEMAENYPQELYRYNLERGVDPDNPVTFDATSNLISKPELGFNFSEGGITSLRSKYEYKK